MPPSPYSQPPISNQQLPPQQQQQQPYHNHMHPNQTTNNNTNGINPNNHQQQYLNSTNNTRLILSKPKLKPPPYNPSSFSPVFGPITVTDPILVQSPGVFSGPPHWIYNVMVRDKKNIDGQDEDGGFSQVVGNVRRRFRHFVALEDRLKADCLGAILPPRYVFCSLLICIVV